jgi:hypothetical protein
MDVTGLEILIPIFVSYCLALRILKVWFTQNGQRFVNFFKIVKCGRLYVVYDCSKKC